MKNYTNSTASRKNLSFSLGKKCAIKLSQYFFVNTISNSTQLHAIDLTNNLKNKDYFPKAQTFFKFNDVSNLILIKRVNINGSEYSNSYYIFQKLTLFKIADILLHRGNDVYVVLHPCSIEYISHFNCFKVLNVNKTSVVFKPSAEIVVKPIVLFKLHSDICFKIRHL